MGSTNSPAVAGGVGTQAALVIYRNVSGNIVMVGGVTPLTTLLPGTNSYPAGINVQTGHILGIYADSCRYAHGTGDPSTDASGASVTSSPSGTVTLPYVNGGFNLNISAQLV